MITASCDAHHSGTAPTALPTPSWQRQLAAAITDPFDLLQRLGLDPAGFPGGAAAIAQATRGFALRVPESFVRRMRHADASDPLLRQVLPIAPENDAVPGFGPDPVGESLARRGGGLLQKYRGRALLIATQACGVHCRYCFRREFPYDEDRGSGARWSAALAELAADASIDELILSGGDPLSLSDARLTELTQRLDNIPHLRRLRIHTRQPIVLPARVDDGFMGWLRTLRWPVVIVVHANHAQEIDGETAAALQRLRTSGATVLNQSVLLRGVNDSTAALAALSHALFDAGVLPYYLHLLDRVRGSAHFEVTESEAVRMHGELLSTLPGYLVPRLVREVAHAPSKVPIATSPARR